MSDVHVVPSGDGWALEVDGREGDPFGTQDEAIQWGRRLAEQENGELVIHGQDGRIRDKDSHGNDPRDIPG
jgi:Uncharacterized protein conserved in bacteria (DUF2188)